MGYILEAVGLFARNPRLWRYALLPMLLAAVFLLAIFLGGYVLLSRYFSLDSALGWITMALYVVAWILLSGFLFIATMSVAGSLLWDRLSLEVERIQTGSQKESSLPTSVALPDSVSRLAFTLGWAIVGLVGSFVVPVVPGVLVAGWIALHDFTASPFLRRGIMFREQRRRVRTLPSWFSFVVGAGVISLIPILNALMAPILVTAGTLMFLRGTPEGQRA